MYFIFALTALLCWSGSDLLSKMGTIQQDKYSHWKVIFCVGLIMGLHGCLCVVVSSFIDTENVPSWLLPIIYTDFKPIDFIRYLPIAGIYLSAMVVGYAGLRYIELSVSSPICNSSGSLALIICIIAGWATLEVWSAVGVALITIGIIALGIVEYKEDEELKILRQKESNFKYSKSFVAILIPIIYLLMDSLGTVGDQLVSELELFDMSEYASNTAYEFSALFFSIIAIVYLKIIKKEKFFYIAEQEKNSTKKIKCALLCGALCETLGQAFYMTVMFSDFKEGMPMISAYCVVSLLWSRIFLKEKLSRKHYIAIAITLLGIIFLGIFSPV